MTTTMLWDTRVRMQAGAMVPTPESANYQSGIKDANKLEHRNVSQKTKSSQ